MQPREKMSAERPLRSNAATSGAQYFNVPRSIPEVALSLKLEKSVDCPKSVNQVPFRDSRILSGLRSLCLMQLACRYAIALAIHPRLPHSLAVATSRST